MVAGSDSSSSNHMYNQYVLESVPINSSSWLSKVTLLLEILFLNTPLVITPSVQLPAVVVMAYLKLLEFKKPVEILSISNHKSIFITLSSLLVVKVSILL